MPELKRPLESSDSTALVLAKKPRNELVEVTDKSKALVQSVSLDHRSLIEYRIGFYKRSFAERPRITQASISKIIMSFLGTSANFKHGCSDHAFDRSSR